MKIMITIACIALPIMGFAQTDSVSRATSTVNFLENKASFVSRKNYTVAKLDFLTVSVMEVREMDLDSIRHCILLQWTYYQEETKLTSVIAIEEDEMSYVEEKIDKMLLQMNDEVRDYTEYRLTTRYGLEVAVLGNYVPQTRRTTWEAGVNNKHLPWSGKNISRRQLVDLKVALKLAHQALVER